jgi:acetyl esterase/lipase
MVDQDPEILSRPAPSPDLTIRYGSHPEQVIDIRLPPAGSAAAAAVIFVHGGSWRAAYDRAHAGPLSADLAARGYPVATIEYRRVGHEGGGWPGTADDVVAAISAAHAALPPSGPPVVAGHSAGGQLALWYAARAPVRGVLALAPLADLVLSYRMGLVGGAVVDLLGGRPDEVPARYVAADPMRHLPLGVPVVIVHGDADDVVPVEVARSYLAAARDAGDGVTLVELPGTDHFEVIDPLSAAWPAVLDGLARLARPA